MIRLVLALILLSQNKLNIRVEFPEIFKFLLEPHRYHVCYGGRASGKSFQTARALILAALSRKERILCAREVQRSLRDSVHRLLSDQIEALGLSRYFDLTRDEIRCLATGSTFIFTGLASNTVESIKSLEGSTICWVEEAQTVSERSWSLLIPTIRAPGSQFYITMNPELDTDPTYVRFVKNARYLDDCVSKLINFPDNPFFPEVLRPEMERLKKADPDQYLHIWEGGCVTHTDANCFDTKRLHYEDFTVQAGWSPMFGVDWGYAADPCCMVKVWSDQPNHALYVEYELVKTHVEIDMLTAWFDTIPDAKRHVIRADSSRPELINYCRRNEYQKMRACRKWDGCHMDAVDYLRSFYDIYFHTRCPISYNEFRTLRYRVDRITGDVQPEVDDSDRRDVEINGQICSVKDDTVDAIAYAIEPLILGYKQKVEPRSEPPGLLVDPMGNPIRSRRDQSSHISLRMAMNPNAWMS